MAYTRTQHHTIGKRHGSGAVAKEGSDGLGRWTTDADVLRFYGHGPTRLTKFKALLDEHTTLRDSHPELIALKQQTVAQAADTAIKMKEWRDQADSVLEVAGEDHEEINNGHSAVKANTSHGPDAQIAAYVALLTANKDNLDPDCDPDTLIADGTKLVTALRELLPEKTAAKEAAVADSEEIDVLDGKLVVMIASLNRAARRAFRKLGLKAKVSSYKYHHLNRRVVAVDVAEESGGEDTDTTEPVIPS
jgi:uncharacterized protein (DUF2252 family)